MQGWRANCDVQILIYNSDPDDPDPADVAKVTDYMVSYACKGSDSLQTEKEKLKKYIIGLKDDAFSMGNVSEARTLARKILNKSLAKKVISKQECMVHVAQLPLLLCSDMLELVSISGSYKLSKEGEGNAGSFLQSYARRKANLDLSLDDYFHVWKSKQRRQKNAPKVIPHYVGGSSYPVYPASLSYARSVLLIHKPWHRKFETNVTRDCLKDFNEFIMSPQCPMKVKIAYECIKHRVITSSVHAEATSQVETVNYAEFSLDIDKETADAVAISSTLNVDDNGDDNDSGFQFDIGLDHNWAKPQVKVHYRIVPLLPYHEPLTLS